MMDAEEAVRRLIGGDDEAFDYIVRHWERRIYNLAWRMVGNREDAQDIVQETFLSAFRSIKGLRDPGNFSAWLYQIALNHCRMRWKHRASNRRDDVAADQLEDKDYFEGALTVEHGADQFEKVDIIRKALAGLSEDHKTAIVLKEYVGLSLEELASVMQCPLSTAKSRLYHGLQEVQRNLKRLGVK
jgi:RNA polymerase sigma-70 factor (ECF subfamily)